MSLRLIRSTNSEPVSVYDDAIVFHSAKGHDYTGDKRGGVFDGVYLNFNNIQDNVNHKFIVKSGMGMLYGRQFELPENETIEFELETMSNKYLVVYVEIVASHETRTIPAESDEDDDEEIEVDVESINIRSQYSSSSYPTIGNQDLIKNRYGTATMELYRVKVGSNGMIENVIDRRYIYRAGYAEKARMMDGDGVINNRKISNLVFSDKDQVKHTDHAYYADYAKSIGSTGVSVTRNAIDDKLFMKYRDAYLVTSKSYVLRTASQPAWGKGTYTVSNVGTGLKGTVVAAFIRGSDLTAGEGYPLADVLDGTANLKLVSEVPYNNEGRTSDTLIRVTIEVNNGTATITVEGDNANISGSLLLVILLIGGEQ